MRRLVFASASLLFAGILGGNTITPQIGGGISNGFDGGISSPSSSFTFFVDSVNGNDSNSGTSAAKAFQNITALPTITAGQSVGLARGSYWRQELRISANNVTVGSYGSGALPILDGSNQVLNANITKTGGFTNIYQTPSLTFAAGGTSAWVNFFETGGPGDGIYGSFLTNVSAEATVDTTPCSYFISGMTPDGTLPATGTIFFHSCDGTSPITNGYTYEYSNRPTGLYLNGLNNIAVNIETRKAADDLGSLQCQTDGAACQFNGVISRLGGKHNAFAACGSSITNSYFIDGYYSTTGSNLLVFFDNTGTGKPISISGSYFQQDQWLSGVLSSAIISHTAGGSCGNVSLSNVWMIAKNPPATVTFSGPSFANAGTVTFNSVYSSALAMFATFQQTSIVNNSQAVSASLNNNQIQLLSGAAVTLNNAKICSGNINNGLIFANAAGINLTINGGLYYVNTPVTNFAVLLQAPNATTWSVNGADIGTAQTSGAFYLYNNFSGSGSVFTGSNNLYEVGGNTGNWALNGTYETSLASWQTLTSQDAGSTVGTGSASNACTLPTIPVIN